MNGALPSGTIAILAVLTAGCGEPEPPPDMVRLSTGDGWEFSIDRYEFPNQAGAKPVTYVNMPEAQEACAGVGKRLCTAAEWRRACLGPDGVSLYGYGSSYVAGACFVGSHLPSGHTSMMDPSELIEASGARAGCVTPEGVHDLVGNLEEWVLDDWRGVDGMVDGGAWYTYPRYADCSGRYSRQPDYRLDPGKRVYSAGFRCCTSPEAPGPEQIAADARAQLEASLGSRELAYEPSAEVRLADGLWMDRLEYPNRLGELPLTGVTGVEAAELCQAAGKRLCGAHEWERACGGSEHSVHPYGDRFVPSACAVELAGPVASGRYLGCLSTGGVQDLVGSVWEWTATPLDLPALKSHPEQVLLEIRGGSWYTDPSKATCQAREGYPAAPEAYAFPDVGFRCCRGEPASREDARWPARVRCPAGMVAIGDGCIDAFEYPAAQGELPQGNLDWAGAQAACLSRGARVCTEEEWVRACAGPEHRRWPYGNVYQPDRCHDESRSRESNAGEATPAGSQPGCATPEGAFDMSGNLWEWAETPTGPALLGGGWNIGAGLGQCTAKARPSPAYSAAETGTRCCHDGLGTVR